MKKEKMMHFVHITTSGKRAFPFYYLPEMEEKSTPKPDGLYYAQSLCKYLYKEIERNWKRGQLPNGRVLKLKEPIVLKKHHVLKVSEEGKVFLRHLKTGEEEVLEFVEYVPENKNEVLANKGTIMETL